MYSEGQTGSQRLSELGKKAPVVQKGWKGLEPGEPPKPKVLEMAAKQSTPSMEWNALYACLGHGRRRVEAEERAREFLLQKKVQEASSVQDELKHVRHVKNHQE